MNTKVIFRSERFCPVLPDECQVNPGRFGAELTYWLSAELAKAGVITSYPNYEDWGWFIEYTTEAGDEYWFCCSNVEGEDSEWMCFLEPKGKGIFWTEKPPLENAEPLLSALVGLLDSESSISDIRWSAHT